MQVMKSAMQVEASASASVKAFEMVQQLASSNAVVVFSCSDCCMSTVVKRLLFSLGVGPTIVELDEHASGQAMEAALYQLSGTLQPVLAVFVGGKFLGGVQTLMASHINGSLIPLLKEAGALWL
nr:glutaredoxin-C9-like [Arachis hypogaea]